MRLIDLRHAIIKKRKFNGKEVSKNKMVTLIKTKTKKPKY